MAGNGLLRTKSVERSIADTDEPETKLRKDLSAWDLTVFGVAVVIGAGIFTLTARTAGDMSGPSVSVAFVLAAIACALAALCYAEFASTVPVAGSAYTYSYATFGELFAWIIGWDLILEFAVAAAAVAKGWSVYLQTVLGYLFGDGVQSSFEVGGLTVDWGALVLVGIVVALAATFFRADKLEEMVNVGTLFAFILVSAAVVVLRRARPDLPRGFRVPWVPVVPILAILACLWLMLNLTVLTWLRFIVWMIAGFFVYFAYSRRHSLLGLRMADQAR